MTVGTVKTSSQLPRVSVIIPTYNRSRLLQATVESALAQTYPNIEVIVVDDGSTDDTGDLMAKYTGRVTYLRQANRNAAAARNTGFRAASGEYLTFLDDDDLILPTKIERQAQVLASRPGVGLVHCRFYYADEAGNYLYKVGLLPEGAVLPRLVCSNFVWMGAPLIRRDCLDQVGLFDEGIPSVTADWDMWLRIARAGHRFGCVQELLGAYRMHRNSMMCDVTTLERGMFAVLEKVFSDPCLPADVAALKDQAYGKSHLWVSLRYYDGGQWEDAQRNLAAALVLWPWLAESPQELARLLSNHALSHRVGDPLQFIAGVLDHLPACADDLRRHRSRIFSQVHLGLAMRSYAAGDIADANRQLAAALALDPARFEQGEDFARLLCHSAVHLPVSDPFHYVNTVLQNLPAPAQRLRRVRARALSGLNLELAYRHYVAGERRQAVHRILRALRHRPVLISDRGAVSILLRSLPAATLGRTRPALWSGRA